MSRNNHKHKQQQQQQQQKQVQDADIDEMDSTTDFFGSLGNDPGYFSGGGSGTRSTATKKQLLETATKRAPILGKRGAALRDAEARDPDMLAGGVKMPGSNRILLPAVGTRVIESEAALRYASAGEAEAGRAMAEQRLLALLVQRHSKNGAATGKSAVREANSKKAKKGGPRRK